MNHRARSTKKEKQQTSKALPSPWLDVPEPVLHPAHVLLADAEFDGDGVLCRFLELQSDGDGGRLGRFRELDKEGRAGPRFHAVDLYSNEPADTRLETDGKTLWVKRNRAHVFGSLCVCVCVVRKEDERNVM